MFRTSRRAIGPGFRECRCGLGPVLAAMLLTSAPAAGGEPAAAAKAADRPADPATGAEVAALRAEVAGRLQAIGAPAPSSAAGAGTNAPGATATATAPAKPAEPAVDAKLRELLQERLRILDEYDKELAALRKASHPEPSPEKQADEARSELGRLQALLAQAAANPEVLLPQAFRAGGRPSVSAEMKDAIEAATSDCKECQAKLEAMRAEAAEVEVRQNARRAERDRLFQAVAAMKARGAERPDEAEAATAPAPASASPAATVASRRMAQERRANAEWKARLSTVRLQSIEAQIAIEARMAGVRELTLQVAQAQEQVASRTLALLQSRYSAAAERQERVLKARAADEEKAALRSDDPLERYRARRRAELLDLEAQVVKHEQALATSPSPSLAEQLVLADRAGHDFERVKELLDDGRVSRLDAIRLNNDFRRIGPERERLLRNEMAIAEARLQYYEDALTGVEIELLQDSLHDRLELELLKESLPAPRWAAGQGLLAALERDHRALLDRRRKVLEQLCEITARTLDQVARRLSILDEEYAFIRTHIFWVRDREAIGPATIEQGAREGQHLARALARLAHEAAARRSWGRASPEFLTAALAALGLPIGLVRVRRMLRARLAREMPGSRPGPTRGA